MSDGVILVTGGAGYIGSHMVKMLRGHGREVLVLDDLSTGFEEALLGAPLVRGSIGDVALLDKVFAEHPIAAVMNFASFIAVGESVTRPDAYYLNNVANTLVLLNAMQRHGVRRYIFSSTAAIYGNPESVPIHEGQTKLPINPYGRSKWMIEQVLEDFQVAFGFESVCLRYFNAAGADPDGQLGERHDPETHLIPLVLQAASGRRESISVFGDDYDTPDGTCIRDYIHVQDLCAAHLLALNHLLAGGKSRRYNLGNGQGFSVKEVIDVARAVTQRPIEVRMQPRRAGDPPRLIADSRLIQAELNWRPEFADLSTIVAHAWGWEQTFKTRSTT
jgi:UDP-glucose 4-epimerase